MLQVTIAFALASSQCWASRSNDRLEEDCCECEGTLDSVTQYVSCECEGTLDSGTR